MILLSAEVRNARTLSMASPLAFDPSRVNVVYGPNGSGKSTLFETMRMALVAGFNSSASGLMSLQPWESDASPFASIVFEHGGQRYRLTKQFLGKPSSRLEIALGAGGWQLHQAGKGADDVVRGFLRASGMADMGLLSMLWTPQGQVALTGSLSGNVLDDVRLLLGAQIAGRAGAEIAKGVARRREVYFTETGRQKKNSPLTPLLADLHAAHDRARAAQTALDRIEAYREAAQLLKDALEAVSRKLEPLEAELAGLEKSGEEYEKLLARAGQARIVQRNCQLEYAEQTRRFDRITELRRCTGKLRERLPELEEADAACERERFQRMEAAQQAAQSVSETLSAESEAKDAAERLERARQWIRLREQERSLRERVDNIERLRRKADGIAEEIAGLAAPGDGALQAIRQHALRVDQLQARWDALALRMELFLERDLPIELIKGGDLSAAVPVVIRGVGEIVLKVAGLGRIRVTGPHERPEVLEASLMQARAELDALCRPYGTADPERLSELAANRQTLELRREGLAAEVRIHLEGKPLDFWVSGGRKLAGEMEAIGNLEPGWNADGPAIAILEQAANEKEARAREFRKAAFERVNGANLELQEAAGRRDRARNLLENARRDLANASGELDALEADGLTYEARGEKLAVFRRKAEAAENEAGEIERQLGAFDAGLLDRLKSVRAEVQMLRQSAVELTGEMRDAEAAQRALLQQSAYTSLALAEEEATALARDIAQKERERAAIELLHAVLERRREAALRGLPGPVAAKVEELLREFAGRPVGRIELTQDFLAASMIPAATTERRELEAFSGGEQEQIHVALRLALADHCAENERQLMVLDDSLLNTDDIRLRRVLAAMEQRREKLQFVILTCHPERYRALGDANWIALGEGREAGAAAV